MKHLDKLWKHKREIGGIVATAAAEISEINYIEKLRNVVTEPYVGSGLKEGKVLTTPAKIVVCPQSFGEFITGNWAHLVKTTTGQSMPTYAKNIPVANLLNASQNPVVITGVLAATAAPIVMYGGYRLAKAAYPTTEKNMERLSETILPELAYEKFKGLYSGIKRRVNGDYNEK